MNMNRHAEKNTWLFVDGAQDFGGHEVMLLRWMQELYAQDQVQVVLLARAQSKFFLQGAGCAQTIALPLNPSSMRSLLGVFKMLATLVHDMWVFASAYRKVNPAIVVV